MDEAIKNTLAKSLNLKKEETQAIKIGSLHRDASLSQVNPQIMQSMLLGGIKEEISQNEGTFPLLQYSGDIQVDRFLSTIPDVTHSPTLSLNDAGGTSNEQREEEKSCSKSSIRKEFFNANRNRATLKLSVTQDNPVIQYEDEQKVDVLNKVLLGPEVLFTEYDYILLNFYGFLLHLNFLLYLALKLPEVQQLSLSVQIIIFFSYQELILRTVNPQALQYLLGALYVSIFYQPLSNEWSLDNTKNFLHFFCLISYFILKIHPYFTVDNSFDYLAQKIIINRNHQEKNSSLKKLINKIPFGIGVVDLQDFSHFNDSFASIINYNTQELSQVQIVEALKKFRRKTHKGGQLQAIIDKKAKQSTSSTDAFVESDLKRSEQTNLLQDLKFITNNLELVYDRREGTIFETYMFEFYESFSSGIHEDALSASHTHFSKHAFMNKRKSTVSNFSGSKGKKAFYNVSICQVILYKRPCFLITVKDVTSQKLIDKEEIYGKLRNMIFKSYTHELNTPLHQMSITTENGKILSKKILKMSSGTELSIVQQKQQNQLKQMLRYFKLLKSCLLTLRCSLHDFFDFTLIDGESISLRNNSFNLRECIKDVCNTVKNQIDPQLITFEFKEYINLNQNNERQVNKVGSEKLHMIGDQNRLQQVLLNLLMNSIKFTKEGYISLTMKLYHQNIYPYTEVVKFLVEDTGFGIHQSRLKNIFNLFEREDNANIDEYIDMSSRTARVGLPISQRLCNLMGGTINVISEENSGSLFYFTLPINYHSSYGQMVQDDEIVTRRYQNLSGVSFGRVKNMKSSSLLLRRTTKREQTDSGSLGEGLRSFTLHKKDSSIENKESCSSFRNSTIDKKGIEMVPKERKRSVLYQGKKETFAIQNRETLKLQLGSVDKGTNRNSPQFKEDNNVMFTWEDQISDTARASIDVNKCATQEVKLLEMYKNNKQEQDDKRITTMTEEVKVEEKRTKTLEDEKNLMTEEVKAEGKMKRQMTLEEFYSIGFSGTNLNLNARLNQITQENIRKNKFMDSVSSGDIKEEGILEDLMQLRHNRIQEQQPLSGIFNQSSFGGILGVQFDNPFHIENIIETFQAQQKIEPIIEEEYYQKWVKNSQSDKSVAPPGVPNNYTHFVRSQNNMKIQQNQSEDNPKQSSRSSLDLDEVQSLNLISQNVGSSSIVPDFLPPDTQKVKEECQCPRFMIVDDIQVNRVALIDMLELIAEKTCIEASNGQECVQQIRKLYEKRSCDKCLGLTLIFMDIEMPVMDGYEATAALLNMMEQKEIPAIPIVAITAFSNEKEMCLRKGFSDFIDKPASVTTLKEILKKFR